MRKPHAPNPHVVRPPLGLFREHLFFETDSPAVDPWTEERGAELVFSPAASSGHVQSTGTDQITVRFL